MSFYFSFEKSYEKDFDKGGEALVKVVERALDGSDYENGELETIRDTANNTASFVARLCLLLIEKKLISKDELKKVIDPSILGFINGNYVWPSKDK